MGTEARKGTRSPREARPPYWAHLILQSSEEEGQTQRGVEVCAHMLNSIWLYYVVLTTKIFLTHIDKTNRCTVAYKRQWQRKNAKLHRL